MAVDTQEKRMNAAAVGRAWLRTKLATGTFDEQARINVGLGYGGNALSPPTFQASALGMTVMGVFAPGLSTVEAYESGFKTIEVRP